MIAESKCLNEQTGMAIEGHKWQVEGFSVWLLIICGVLETYVRQSECSDILKQLQPATHFAGTPTCICMISYINTLLFIRLMVTLSGVITLSYLYLPHLI